MAEQLRDDLPAQGAETYLGDGVHASFDGWQVVLRAPREHGDHTVCLEPPLWAELRRWLARYPRLEAHMEAG